MAADLTVCEGLARINSPRPDQFTIMDPMTGHDPYPLTDEDPIARALGYPYPAHPEDYLFDGTSAHPLPEDHGFEGLTPVIAVGSNRSPRQLARKYAPRYMGGPVRIPVTRIRARDVDVVYAAHLAGYGSAPATLAPSEGTVVELWVNWLDGAALERMDATEGLGVQYDRVTVALEVTARPGRPAPREMLLYAARRGLANHDGAPVALAEVPADGRRYPALGQREMLQRLHARHKAHPDLGFEDWLTGLIGAEGDAARFAVIETLAAEALKPPLPNRVA